MKRTEILHLTEEEYDYYRDYKAGLISWEEYQDLVNRDKQREKEQRWAAQDRDRGPWYLKIDGKIYKQKGEPKSFDWKSGASKYGMAILKNRPELQGKIFLTKKLEDSLMAEGAMKDFAIQNVIDQLLDGDLDAYDVMNRPQGPAQEQMAMILQDMYDDVVTDTRLHPDDDFEEIIDRMMDRLEDDYGHSGDNEGIEEAGMLKVAKDDEKQTILQNPTTGVQTQIDKTNPNAPRLTQDDKGKLTLAMPQGAQSGGLGADKPASLVGKEVQVDQMPEMVDIKRLAGL